MKLTRAFPHAGAKRVMSLEAEQNAVRALQRRERGIVDMERGRVKWPRSRFLECFTDKR